MVKQCRELGADLIVSCFPRYEVPDELLSCCFLGCMACYPSLLPRHLGPSPCQWTIIKGDKESGATWYRQQPAALIEHALVLSQRSFVVDHGETAASLLADRVYPAALDGLGEAVVKMLKCESGDRQVGFDKNNDMEELLEDRDCIIDWKKSAYLVSCIVRGADPFPGSLTQMGNTICRLYGCTIEPPLPGTDKVDPGTIHAIRPEGLVITTGTFPVSITQIQAVDSKELRRSRLPAARFASMMGLTPGTQLVTPTLADIKETQQIGLGHK